MAVCCEQKLIMIMMLLFFDLLADYYVHEYCTTCADFRLCDMACAHIYIYKNIEYTHVNMIPCVQLRYKISHKQDFFVKRETA